MKQTHSRPQQPIRNEVDSPKKSRVESEVLRPVPAESNSPGAFWSVLVFILFGIIVVCAMAFLPERGWGTEERTLIAAPYMFEHYGHLAFPPYGYGSHPNYHHLFVHPPTHYLLIGLLMKAGLGLYYAEAVPLVFFAAFCLVMIWKIGHPLFVTLGLLMGFISAMGWLSTAGYGDYSYNLRPDGHMALALIAGLLCLECARMHQWSIGWLFAGAFLVAYASTVHYSGLAGWLSVFPYLVIAWRQLERRAFLRRFTSVAVGGCLAGVPYIFLHIVPNWDNLKPYFGWGMVGTGELANIKANFAIYADALQQWAGWPFPRLFYASPLNIVLAWSIPPFVIAFVLLAASRNTRVLAVGSLPTPLFLFFVFHRKFFAYLYPEIILLLMGLWLLIGRVFARIAGMTPQRYKALPSACLALFFVVAFSVTTPALRGLQWNFAGRYHEMTLGRAAAKQIVGPDARTTSIHSDWYLSGGSSWFDLTPDLLMGKPPANPGEFWRRFDAMAVPLPMGFPSQSGETEATLYEQGVERLCGFEDFKFQNGMRLVWLTARRRGPVTGFFWEKDRFHKFVEAPEGEYTLVSFPLKRPLAELDTISNSLGALDYWAMAFAKSPGETVDRYIVVVLFDAGKYRGLPAEYTPIEVIRGHATPLDPAMLVSQFDEQRDTIRFDESYAESLSSLAKPIGKPGRPLRWSTTKYAQGAHSEDGASVVSADLSGWQALAVSDHVQLEPDAWYLASLDFRLDFGHVTINLMHEGDDRPQLILYREDQQDHNREQFVFRTTDAPTPTYLTISANNGYQRRRIRFSLKRALMQRVQVNP